MSQLTTTQHDLEQLRTIIANDGVQAALEYLNRRTPHRFNGVFRFVGGGKLENPFLFDREESNVVPWQPFDETRSYCSIVHATNAPFFVSNSMVDGRVIDHPRRDVIISYCGVPIRYADKRLYGSLCHFDFKPVVTSELDLPFLKIASDVLAESVAVLPVSQK